MVLNPNSVSILGPARNLFIVFTMHEFAVQDQSDNLTKCVLQQWWRVYMENWIQDNITHSLLLSWFQWLALLCKKRPGQSLLAKWYFFTCACEWLKTPNNVHVSFSSSIQVFSAEGKLNHEYMATISCAWWRALPLRDNPRRFVTAEYD